MKIKEFDVVELNNKNNATILSIDKDSYNAEIISKDGVSLGYKLINDSDINKVIYARK